jgi:carboxyl-terminal processing protease
MIDGDTGYLKLGEFTETSNHEVGAALDALTAKGMKRLVLDLRDNPGGALDQAIAISNRFLPRGDLIVYTKGRSRNSDQEYRATEQSDYTHLPVVVMVNRNSASASEIVSGALQDHDRALVVGETTFGKALVQSVYKISEQAGLALTTGRYYTPSGRMIQRPWDGTFDEYLTYIYRDQDGNKAHKESDLKLTDSGRKVYGGGGIEPDRRFDGPSEGFNPTRFGRSIAARNLFDVYAQQFSRRGDTRLTRQGGKIRELDSSYEVTDQMLGEFKALVQKSPIVFDEAAWRKDLDFIKAMMHREIDMDLFGVAVAYANLAKSDPQLQYALGLFPEAQQLLESGRQAQSRRAAK